MTFLLCFPFYLGILVFSGNNDIEEIHIEEDENRSAWHNKTIYYGEPHCQAYQTDYIHHDAQYQTIYHDPEYRIVHHEGRTYEKRVWVEE
ncbi:MAG: hypothetical protein IIW22_03985 [Erysipelotrichaceae bacterium]|nr:hypothetical protein [Erysipelotrichaceae bacterium]